MTSVEMAQQIGAALQDDGISQAEFCRTVGVSTKHLNQVIRGNAVATPAALDYWAFVLGRHFVVLLAPGVRP